MLNGVFLIASATAHLAVPASAPEPPPIERFLLDEELELALALSAAPESVTRDAALLVLRADGYQLAREGKNGFTCLVLRAWDGPGAERSAASFYDVRQRAPICFNPEASKSILEVHLRRTELVARGETLETIKNTLAAELSRGALRFTAQGDGLAVAYMFSSGQRIGPDAGKFMPHVMIYAPGMTNADAGGMPLGPHPFVLGGGANEPPVLNIPVSEFIEPVRE